MLQTFQIVAALGILSAAVFSSRADADKLTAADRAWINTCMAQRTMNKEQPTKIRKYCTCMQSIVDNNEPFDSIGALEHTYPPAHQMCWKDAGKK